MVVLAGVALVLLAGATPRELFDNARLALQKGDLPAAERGFRDFLKLRPGHPAALGNLGVVYTRTSRFGEAVKAYTEALQKAPKEPDLHLNLGLAWLKQGDHKSARPHFEQALSLRPQSRQARELLATTLLFTGGEGQAIQLLEGEAQPDGSTLYLLAIGYQKVGRSDQAKTTIERLFAVLPPAQARMLAGRAYYESALFEEAQAEFEAARRIDAALPGLQRELGKNYVSLRNVDEARTALEAALRTDPADLEAAYFLGALFVQEGRQADGVPLLERAREASPGFWGPPYYLGKAALAQGRAAQAAEFYRRASELRPDDMSVLFGLARALKAAGRDEEARAVSKRYSELQSKGVRKAEESLVDK